MKISAFILLLLLAGFFVQAQNGKILQQTVYKLADSNITALKKIDSGVEDVLAKVRFSSIRYLSDGLAVNGFLAMPALPGKYPCVIYNRGGNRELGAITDTQLGLIIGQIASWGYIAVASQYRGNMGGEGKEEFGGKEVNDILNLVPLLSNIRGADTSRMGMYGWSRGGMMTYLALTKTQRIKAAVTGSGMADAILNTARRPDMKNVFAELAPGFAANPDSVLKSRSAVYWADSICKSTPLLLLCGSADWRVFPEEQFAMLNSLYKAKHPTRFIMLEGGQHSLTEHLQEVNWNARRFLDKYVRDLQQWPSMEVHGN